MSKLALVNPFRVVRAREAELLASPSSALKQRIAAVPTTFAADGKSVLPKTKSRGNYLGIHDIIDAKAAVHGDFVTENSVMIDGTIEGGITVTGTSRLAILRESSVVRGTVTAPLVMVAGLVEGDIHARSLRIMSTATIRGNIYAERMGVDPGANLVGSVINTGTAASEQRQATEPQVQPEAACA